MKPFVAIVDYKMSNLYSVQHACDALGIPARITSDAQEILKAEAVILPGVGAFGDAMKNIHALHLDTAMATLLSSGRRLMGVCLGMQLLFEKSNEFGVHKGLGFLDGDVVRFPNRNASGEKVKVPQIGWNTVCQPKNTQWAHTPFQNVHNNEYMYFVHSYFVRPRSTATILSMTAYEGIEYCSAVHAKNIFAVQFHPEKSGEKGIQLYKFIL